MLSKCCLWVLCVIASVLAVSVVHADEFTPVAVSASSHYQDFVPEGVLDKSLQTTWRAFGSGQWIQLDLGSEQLFNTVRIAWHAGKQRTAKFLVSVSSDGTAFEEVWDDVASGTSDKLETYSIMLNRGRYVRITGLGNNKNLWNSIAEIEVAFVFDPNVWWAPVAITASSFQPPNAPANVNDNNALTRWSALGDGQWIQLDVGIDCLISEFEILWYQPGKPRKHSFTIEVRRDGETEWTEVFAGDSAGSPSYEIYQLEDMVLARYVRLTGYGNTANEWNSINEMHIWGWDEIQYCEDQYWECEDVQLDVFGVNPRS